MLTKTLREGSMMMNTMPVDVEVASPPVAVPSVALQVPRGAVSRLSHRVGIAVGQ